MGEPYWKFVDDFTDDNAKWEFDTQKYFYDVFEKMYAIEEETALKAVIAALRAKGYTVTPPEGGG
jgi:hypothetical protein